VSFCEAELRFLLLFLEKEGFQVMYNPFSPFRDFLGARPQIPGVRFADFEHSVSFCEAELRFLLLFLEKEELQAIYNPFSPLIWFFFWKKQVDWKRRLDGVE
jgi:hypothetical protein